GRATQEGGPQKGVPPLPLGRRGGVPERDHPCTRPERGLHLLPQPARRAGSEAPQEGGGAAVREVSWRPDEGSGRRPQPPALPERGLPDLPRSPCVEPERYDRRGPV